MIGAFSRVELIFFFINRDQEGVKEEKRATKPSLKCVLNPVQMRDAMSMRNSPIYNDHAKLSPEVFTELTKDLNSPKGKGSVTHHD
jgi:hypothetical protein